MLTNKCVQCGYCCLHWQCKYSIREFGILDRCPYLKKLKDNTFECQLIKQGHPDVLEFLKVEQGCFMPDNPLRQKILARGSDET
jgi:hypothetical protein